MWYQHINHNIKAAPTVEEVTPTTGPARTLVLIQLGDQRDLMIYLSWAELTDLSDAINTAIIKHAPRVATPTIVTEELFDAELG